MGNAIHYFINTNSSKGFVSFFKSNFEPLERVIKLDNYPTAIGFLPVESYIACLVLDAVGLDERG